MDVRLTGDVPTGRMSLFLEAVDAILALVPEWIGSWNIDALIKLGELAVYAGGLLLKSNDLRRASKYFERARAFEEELLQSDEYDPEEWGDFDDSDSWRVATARGLRDIHLSKRQDQQARAENERILELCHMDGNALQLRSLLESLDVSDSHAEIRTILGEIQATQKSFLREISLQRAAVERLARLQAEIAAAIQERRLRASEIDGLVDQLNDIVQQGYQIQPAAWKRAHERLDAELGEDIFGQLDPDSQHYIATAEAIFWATESLADRMDAALIAVEYAKAIETEIRGRFLSALAKFLEAQNYLRPLSIGKDPEKRLSGRRGWTRELTSLTLGAAIDLMDKALSGNQNAKVLDFMEKVEPRTDWLRDLVNDLGIVVKRYRIGAAHIERMDRQTLQEFRDLLFRDELLRRIVKLGQRAGQVAASPPM